LPANLSRVSKEKSAVHIFAADVDQSCHPVEPQSLRFPCLRFPLLPVLALAKNQALKSDKFYCIWLEERKKEKAVTSGGLLASAYRN
jgi:hypothetical protein